MNIFFDANIIIYQVEAVPEFGARVRSLLQDILARHPNSSFAVSRLSLLECLVKPFRERNVLLLERYHAFFNSADLSIVEISPQVVEQALRLRAETSLRTPDAIQAASALILPDETVFITGDTGFANIPKLTVRLV